MSTAHEGEAAPLPSMREPNPGQSPVVSVCVIAYNHAPYILECLDGIRRQQGAPSFEVVIRDDASTDETGQLVRAYIERYRLSNFFYYRAASNGGMMPNLTAALGLCRGALVALCEGDDYWIDSRKLQKQHALMNANPGCAISAHACYIHSANGRKRKAFLRGTTIKQFSLREVLLHSSTQFAPTASYMIRRDIVANLPEWFESAPIGDFFLELLSLKQGYGLYMPTPMSAYRVMSSGSWSSSMRNDRRRSIDYGQRMLKLIAVLEEDAQLRDNGLHVLKANVHSLLASDFLLCGDGRSFREHAEVSFALERRWQSRTATFLYRMRRFPTLAAYIYRAKRRLLD